MGKNLVIVDTTHGIKYGNVRWYESEKMALKRVNKHKNRTIKFIKKRIFLKENLEANQGSLAYEEACQYEVMFPEAFALYERNYFLSKPIEDITEEYYRDLLSKVSAKDIYTEDGVEMFNMIDLYLYNDKYTKQFARKGNKCVAKMVDLHDKSTWLNIVLNKESK